MTVPRTSGAGRESLAEGTASGIAPQDDTVALLAVGLPESGKTTFLAALWHVITLGTLPSSLTVDRVSGDRTYLNAIAHRWSDGHALERTITAGGATVQMHLRYRSVDRAFSLTFPDLPGEVFRDAWAHRTWPKDVAEMAATATGILLFIHPDVHEPQRLDVLNRTSIAGGAAELPADATTSSGVPSETESAPWLPGDAPHAVILVDLIQAVLRAQTASDDNAKGESPLRVAVVISAWDLVDAEARYAPQADVANHGARMAGPVPESPSQWVAHRLPFLEQFLRSNPETIQYHVFGVSAQGGALDETHRLLAAPTPEERIRVVGAPGAPNDLTAVVRWSAGGA